jgi:hypothetical protein
VATPKRFLTQFQKDLLLTRSLVRAEKERAMRQRVLKGLRKDLAKLSQAVRSGRVRRQEVTYTRLGQLAERWPSAWSYLKEVALTENGLVWRWDRKKLRNAWFQEGTYLLRTNLQEHDPEKLWRQYMQLTEIEAVFRTLRSELNLRRGGQIRLPRITEPEAPAQFILHRLGWSLPEQPPPQNLPPIKIHLWGQPERICAVTSPQHQLLTRITS